MWGDCRRACGDQVRAEAIRANATAVYWAQAILCAPMATSSASLSTRQRILLQSGLVLMQLGAAAGVHAQQKWTVSLGAATDYVYRGVTRSDGQPAAYAGLELHPASGWSAGVWTSTVDLDRDAGNGYEVDLHAARSWSWDAAWDATLSVAHREYLNERSKVDYDYDELSASLSFQQRVTASVAWSPNASLYLYPYGPVHGRAVAYELMIEQPIGARWSVFAGVGRYDLHDLAQDGYSYWSGGLSFTWASVQFDAAHIGVD
ncbi:MAG TPA: TorF family putative porin, partial [Steroidobacter sp.]|nr:TorF family putative porin [Steroidobacter sp.]